MSSYNKLVRDKIPDIISKNGEKAIVKVLDDKNYKEELDRKLLEEINEYLESDDLEELADAIEVLYAILNYKKVSFDELEKVRENKKQKRGAFEDKLYLVGVEKDQ